MVEAAVSVSHLSKALAYGFESDGKVGVSDDV